MKSIIPDNKKGRCYICGAWGQTEEHHMLHGSRRKMADKYGLTVYLCPRCHRLLHDTGKYDRELEEIAQEAFEHIHGHRKFMEVFGKNYL